MKLIKYTVLAVLGLCFGGIWAVAIIGTIIVFKGLKNIFKIIGFILLLIFSLFLVSDLIVKCALFLML